MRFVLIVIVAVSFSHHSHGSMWAFMTGCLKGRGSASKSLSFGELAYSDPEVKALLKFSRDHHRPIGADGDFQNL